MTTAYTGPGARELVAVAVSRVGTTATLRLANGEDLSGTISSVSGQGTVTIVVSGVTWAVRADTIAAVGHS